MEFTVRALPNPEVRQIYINGEWHERRLTYKQTQDRIHLNVTRPCTRCLGSGHYFDAQCETCSGWGENMIIRGFRDVPKSP